MALPANVLNFQAIQSDPEELLREDDWRLIEDWECDVDCDITEVKCFDIDNISEENSKSESVDLPQSPLSTMQDIYDNVNFTKLADASSAPPPPKRRPPVCRFLNYLGTRRYPITPERLEAIRKYRLQQMLSTGGIEEKKKKISTKRQHHLIEDDARISSYQGYGFSSKRQKNDRMFSFATPNCLGDGNSLPVMATSVLIPKIQSHMARDDPVLAHLMDRLDHLMDKITASQAQLTESQAIR